MDSCRKSSYGDNGRNSGTCIGKGLKLFGVRIWGREQDEEVMRKSSSMVNLPSCTAEQSSSRDNANGYLSDGTVHGVIRRERKRGVPWTEEEHRAFLAGLKKLGKGDWRGISKNFIRTRTPTQVASHAQKYFLRQVTPSTKKRRSSLFDVAINDTDESSEMGPLQPKGTHGVAEEINHLHLNDYAASTSSVTQVPVSSFEASLTVPLAAKWAEQRRPLGFNYMAGNSCGAKNQAVDRSSQVTPTFSLSVKAGLTPSELRDDSVKAPDFLQLSLNSSLWSTPSCPSSTADSVLMEASDLELTIGPPKPLETAKRSSRASNLTGAIKVT